MAEETETRRDIRFCPCCYQQEFDVTGREEGKVYCEICGVDFNIKELEKP